jgi:hypothetical protein
MKTCTFSRFTRYILKFKTLPMKKKALFLLPVMLGMFLLSFCTSSQPLPLHIAV